MNKCYFEQELSAYLDNQLPEKRRLEMEEHLKLCKICYVELERLKALSEKLRTWQAPSLDANFDTSVRSEIVLRELKRSAVPMKKTLAILVPSGAVAVILMLAFFGLFLRGMNQGVQGKWKTAADHTGEQFDHGKTTETFVYDSMAQKGTQRYAKEAYGTQQGMQLFKADYNRENAARETSVIRDATHQEKAMMLSANAASGNFNVYKPLLSSGTYAQNIRGGDGYKPVPYYGTPPQVYPAPAPPAEGSIIVIQPLLPATGEGEKIIRTAEVKLEVEDAQETYRKASGICQELGGYLAASNFYKDSENRQAGNITMRIPKDKFQAALDKLGALGKVENISTASQDVAQEYANLKAQLDAEMVIYKKMLESLEKRQTTIPEAMRLGEELDPVLKRVEDLKNQIEYLNNAVSFTTVNLYFHEAEVSIKALKESSRFVKESLITAAIETTKFMAKVIPALIIGAILAGVVLLIIILLKNWITSLFK